jgi:hypothetical protein
MNYLLGWLFLGFVGTVLNIFAFYRNMDCTEYNITNEMYRSAFSPLLGPIIFIRVLVQLVLQSTGKKETKKEEVENV